MNLEQITDIICYELGRPTDADLQLVVQPLVIAARAMLIRQEFHKTRQFPQSSITSICLPLELVSSTLCCSVDLGCMVARTVSRIPQPIQIKDELNFNYVGGINFIKETSYGYIKPEEIKYIKYRKFTKKLIYYTYVDNYLYLVSLKTPALEKLRIRYVPANPLELIRLKDCDDMPCWNLDDITFIEEHWEDPITKIVLNKLGKTEVEQIKVNDESTSTTTG